MPHVVQFTRRALREIDESLAWLVAHSPAYAAKWHQRLLETIDLLEENPTRFGLAPENEWYSGGELRQLMYGKRQRLHRILFEVRGDAVIVLRVRHHARDLLSPEDLLSN